MCCPEHAASLLQHDIDLAARGIVGGALAQQITHAENRGKRVVQLVCSSRHHLAHRRELFLLQGLLFEPFGLGDIAHRGNDSADLSLGIKKGARWVQLKVRVRLRSLLIDSAPVRVPVAVGPQHT